MQVQLLFKYGMSSLIKSIENAITESNLGINPQTDGQLN